MQRIAILFVLSSTVAVTACKSQLDDAPAATVKDSKKADAKASDAKADAEASDAEAEQAKAEPAPLPEGATMASLDAASSTVGFVGAKVTADHEGSFGKIDGTAAMVDGKPVRIEVTASVGSLEIEPDKLKGHLLSPDFFDAGTYPEAKFVSTAIREEAGEGSTHVIEGDLTLHGVTKSISFPASVELSEDVAKGKAEFKIDRKLFGIVYPGMTDDLIKDDVLLKLDLAFPTNT
ncbi:MAG: YceI family protein [Nannocystaceae bacterium]